MAGALAALLGGSRTLVTGPTGAFVVILAAIVAEHRRLLGAAAAPGAPAA